MDLFKLVFHVCVFESILADLSGIGITAGKFVGIHTYISTYDLPSELSGVRGQVRSEAIVLNCLWRGFM